MTIKLTRHGAERVASRTSENVDYILTLLEEGKYMPLGIEDKSNRQHDLIYIPNDRNWFVVVRDIKTKEMITFLPHDYHNAWRISPDAMRQAKELVQNYEDVKKVEEQEHFASTALTTVETREALTQALATAGKPKPVYFPGALSFLKEKIDKKILNTKVVRLTGNYTCNQDYPKKVSLGSWDYLGIYPLKGFYVKSYSKEFWSELSDRASEKGIQFYRIKTVEVGRGRDKKRNNSGAHLMETIEMKNPFHNARDCNNAVAT